MKWESSLMEHLQWSDTISNRESKVRLARMIAMRIRELLRSQKVVDKEPGELRNVRY